MRAFRCLTVGLTVLLVGFVSFASAGTRRDDVVDQMYLDLGADLRFASVGRVDFMIGSAGYMGSGVLIDSNWVLTAGHVVDEATSLDFTIGGATYSAANWTPHPKWRGDLLAGYDIGLINLSDSEGLPDVAPAVRYWGSGELGAEATIVGYGMTGTGLSGATTFDGQKRAGENVIDVLYGKSRKKQNLLLCDFDNPLDPTDNAFGSATPLDLEFLIAPGDSGGGLFLDVGDAMQLAGINSFISWNDEEGNSDYGDISGHTRVSAFNKWIDEVIAGDGGGGGGHGGGKPSWAGGPKKGSTVIPEPASLSLLAFGALLLLRRRR